MFCKNLIVGLEDNLQNYLEMKSKDSAYQQLINKSIYSKLPVSSVQFIELMFQKYLWW